jgi:hypothetical protein
MRWPGWIWVLFLAVPLSGRSQQPQPINTGEVEGIVFDSLHNYVLRAATVAIYGADTTRPVSYQLTNVLGEFAFKNIPVEIPCKLVCSYVGYKSTIRSFVITRQQHVVALGTINMAAGQKDLEEVVVSYTPPVRMNGDTLEFNPNAFQLGENAVVEDLLRKLPGVIVWGDGAITVNGREVKSVLVEGKPFFGNGTKVATQNIPKDAVEKVQVYQKVANPQNATDSSTEVNIKLKVDKKSGTFGKLSMGYGTRERFDLDGNLNLFTPRTQVTLVATHNNVNKTAPDIKTLLENSTYVGEGASIDYQPEFRQPGITRPLEAGFSLQHDLTKTDNFHFNRLSADYLFNQAQTAIATSTRTTNALQTGDQLVIESQNTNAITATRHQFSSKYEKKDFDQTFTLLPSFSYNNNRSHIITSSLSTDHFSTNQSQNETDNTTEATDRMIGFSGGYDKQKLHTSWSFSSGHANNDQTMRSLFHSSDPAKDRSLDRNYSNNKDYLTGNLTFNVDRFAAIRLNGVLLASLGAGAEAAINTDKQHNNVYDNDPVAGVPLRNNYLSNETNYSLLSVAPYVKIGKTFSKTLTDRYSQSTNVYIYLKEQLARQQNNAGHSFLQFNRNTNQFIPQIGISQKNIRIGKFINELSAGFSITPGYASPGQLLNLVDSTQIYNMVGGNPNLLPFYKREIAFSLSHTSLRKKAPFNYTLVLRAGRISNFTGDSALIDKDGQTVHYTVNLNGYRYMGADLMLRKSFDLNNQSLEIMAKGSTELSDRPNYLNQVYYISRQWSNRAEAALGYSLAPQLVVNFGQSFSWYRSKQDQINSNNFSNALLTTRACISGGITEKLTLTSNISFNSNNSTGVATTHYTIWNANASYRFLKKQNAEVRFSAYDLLHQNVNIINIGTNNNLTVSTNNALSQYFMLTLSYFPRKFGK